MSFETIVLEQDENVAVVTLSRPERLNALSLTLLDELLHVMSDMESDENVKAIVITGGEKVFCAGADIHIFPGLKTPEEVYSFIQRVKYSLGSLRRVVKPVVGAICGYALGGGLELSLCCDIRIASDNAKFGVPEIDLGAFPAAGGSQVLPRLIGAGLAKEMLWGGKPISAQEAYRVGLVNRVYPKEQVMDEALKLAKNLAKKPAYAVRVIKRLVDNGLEMDLDRALTYESSNFLGIWASHDFKEGYTAFIEKRKPKFQGR